MSKEAKYESSLHEGESCVKWEAALAEQLDGALSPEKEQAFRKHAGTCESCATLLRESVRGRDWVRLLHDTPPVVPADLLGKILAKTAELPQPAEGAFTDALPVPSPAFQRERAAGFVMTAAMAFFSIALTLSVSGIRLGDIPAAVHGSLSIQATASRQFFNTKKQVVSFYDNLLVVREVEATVEDLRQSAQGGGEPRPAPREKGKHLQPSASVGLAPLLAGGYVFLRFEAEERNLL